MYTVEHLINDYFYFPFPSEDPLRWLSRNAAIAADRARAAELDDWRRFSLLDIVVWKKPEGYTKEKMEQDLRSLSSGNQPEQFMQCFWVSGEKKLSCEEWLKREGLITAYREKDAQ